MVSISYPTNTYFFHSAHETLFMFLLTVNDSLFLEEREILGYERNP